jgi:hypothetical protein
MNERALVSYRHQNDDEDTIRFVGFADETVPVWAADVQPYEEELLVEEA